MRMCPYSLLLVGELLGVVIEELDAWGFNWGAVKWCEWVSKRGYLQYISGWLKWGYYLHGHIDFSINRPYPYFPISLSQTTSLKCTGFLSLILQCISGWLFRRERGVAWPCLYK